MTAILTKPANIIRAARWRATHPPAERQRDAAPPPPTPPTPQELAQYKAMLGAIVRDMGPRAFRAMGERILGAPIPVPATRSRHRVLVPLTERRALVQRMRAAIERTMPGARAAPALVAPAAPLAQHLRDAWPQVRATLTGEDRTRWDRIGAELHGLGAYLLRASEREWAIGQLDAYGRAHGFAPGAASTYRRRGAR